MACHEFRKRLDAWVDEELPACESAEVARHLEKCADCRLEVRQIQRIVEAMGGLPDVRAPMALSIGVLRAFRSESAKPGMRKWWQELSLAMRGAICGAALAGLLCGAMLGTSISANGSNDGTNPYQTLYASKGILP